MARDAMQTTMDAFVQTEEGRKIKDTCEREAKKIIKDLPPEMLAITQIGIQQEIDYNLDRNNSINLNYRDQSIRYQFQIDF